MSFVNLQIHFAGLLLCMRIQFLPRNNLLLPHPRVDPFPMIQVKVLGRMSDYLEIFPGPIKLHKGCKQVHFCWFTRDIFFFLWWLISKFHFLIISSGFSDEFCVSFPSSTNTTRVWSSSNACKIRECQPFTSHGGLYAELAELWSCRQQDHG